MLKNAQPSDDPLAKYARLIAMHEANVPRQRVECEQAILDLVAALRTERARNVHTYVACKKCGCGVRPAYAHDGMCDRCCDQELARLRVELVKLADEQKATLAWARESDEKVVKLRYQVEDLKAQLERLRGKVKP